MNRVIWKYEMQIADHFSITMPKGAIVRMLAMQGDKPCIWVECNKDAPMVEHRFRVYGTGHPLDRNDGSHYIGSVMLADETLVFHFYNRGEAPTHA